jgi:hypothetical protein
MVRLGISGLLDRLNASLRLLGFSPIARALVPSDLTLEPRPLRSTIVTRFHARMGLSDFHPRPARVLADRRLRGPSPAHGKGSPVLTRESLARMSTPLPRRLGPVRSLLASRTNGGLRPFIAGSAHALALFRGLLDVHSCFNLRARWPPFGAFCTRGFDPGRYQPEPLRLLPVGATVTGWDTFLPLDPRALFTAHDKAELRPRLEIR